MMNSVATSTASHQVRLTVVLSVEGFCEEPSNSVCGDGKRDSCRHFESVYPDDVSILTERFVASVSFFDYTVLHNTPAAK